MALNKQIWTDQIMENFYPEASFLKYAKDMTEFVEYDKINLAEAGIDPAVLKNNTNYPISVTERDDTSVELTLNLYETENTLVQDAIVTEVSYNTMESVISGHRNSLKARTGSDAAHAYSPDGNTTNTPVIKTTGEDNGSGYKALLPKDILTLSRLFTSENYPQDNRYLVLEPRHLEDLINFDLKFFGSITDIENGQPKKFAGFNILVYPNATLYNNTTLAKQAYGSIADEDSTYSSFAFIGSEVMRADGTITMFERLKDPEYRGDIVGFAKRFLGMPIRNKGIAAIIADKIPAPE